MDLRAVDYEGVWNPSALEGHLSCAHGPALNNNPRPYVLFEADGITYGGDGQGWLFRCPNLVGG